MKITIVTILLLSIFAGSISAQTKKAISESDKLIGVNLIKNPGAEKITETNKLIDWETNNPDLNYVSYYGRMAGEWDHGCDRKCGLPENAGDCYFRATADVTPENTKKFIIQNIDFSKLKDTLKVKDINFAYSAQIAGFHCDDTLKCAFGYIKIEFLDSAKQSIKIYNVKKYTHEFHKIDESEGADSRMHKFENISLLGVIPKNAISAAVTLGSEQDCNYDSGESCSDAYVFFDNIRLIFSK